MVYIFIEKNYFGYLYEDYICVQIYVKVIKLYDWIFILFLV